MVGAHSVGLDQDADLHRAGAGASGFVLGFVFMVADLLDLPRTRAVAGRSLFPQAAAGVGRGLQPGPRRQRRAEDDGHHRRRAVRRRLPRRSSRSRSGSCSRRTRRSRSARWSGGWRIIHTMGSKITRLQPVGGFAAETAGAVSLFTATALGVPVSTTHTITGAIVGVGSTRRLSAVRWGIAGQIVWAWILTIPDVRGDRRGHVLHPVVRGASLNQALSQVARPARPAPRRRGPRSGTY